MMSPTLDEVRDYLKTYNTVPVFHEFLYDSAAPVQMFRALSQGCDNAFMLESVSNQEQWGRYSFLGIQPRAELRIKDARAEYRTESGTETFQIEDLAAYLNELMQAHRAPKMAGRPNLTGGFIGYFGYDTIRYVEPRLCHPPKDDLQIPDIDLFLFDELVAYDHLSNHAIVILNLTEGTQAEYDAAIARAQELEDRILSYTPIRKTPLLSYVSPAKEQSGPISITSNMTCETYCEMVRRCKEHIKDGDIFQIVPSQRFEIENPPSPFDVYRMLRSTNPSPYLYYFQTKDFQIAGASPEMLLQVSDGICTTKPIAGTIKRGDTPEEDAENEAQLLRDPKERAEHTMLVDLGRNDIGRVSRFGSVQVEDFMHIERYSKVMHLVSGVSGELQEGKTATDALMSVLPAGTLSGAPKIRAMELIDEMEPQRRGLYGGTVGYLAFDGSLDTCIAIRTVLFRHNKAYVQAGGGVVADSVGEQEFMESQNKALAVIRAIELAAEQERRTF